MVRPNIHPCTRSQRTDVFSERIGKFAFNMRVCSASFLMLLTIATLAGPFPALTLHRRGGPVVRVAIRRAAAAGQARRPFRRLVAGGSLPPRPLARPGTGRRPSRILSGRRLDRDKRRMQRRRCRRGRRGRRRRGRSCGRGERVRVARRGRRRGVARRRDGRAAVGALRGARACGARACRFACMGMRAEGRGAARACPDAQSVRPTRTGIGPLARRLGDRSHASRKPPVRRARPLACTDVCALTDRKHARPRQANSPTARPLGADVRRHAHARVHATQPAVAAEDDGSCRRFLESCQVRRPSSRRPRHTLFFAQFVALVSAA